MQTLRFFNIYFGPINNVSIRVYIAFFSFLLTKSLSKVSVKGSSSDQSHNKEQAKATIVRNPAIAS